MTNVSYYERNIEFDRNNQEKWDSFINIPKNAYSIEYSDIINNYWNVNIYEKIISILKLTFLPVGYPHTVRPEYLDYQLWDSIQCISSSLRSVLSTRSILVGVGVGSSNANALSAAITWVFRDGIGMLGSLIFAYHFSNAFEIYLKEFRYLADILNNIGLTLDLISSYFPNYYFIIVSISTLTKCLCGLIAGATKARISAHFAYPGHLADVTAKESTQETAVSLLGLTLGMIVAHCIGNNDQTIWFTFIVLMFLHLYSNYFLIRVLIFETINPQRCYLIIKQLLLNINSIDNTKLNKDYIASENNLLLFKISPNEIANQENFLLPFKLYMFGPKFGISMKVIFNTIETIMNKTTVFQSHYNIKSIDSMITIFQKCYRTEKFLIGINNTNQISICLNDSYNDNDLMKAYFISYYLYIKLRLKIKLFNSNDINGLEYIANNYIYILDILIPEAFIWYSKYISTILYDKNISNWILSDASGLSSGNFRYKVK